jgi:hypothetical protein
MKLSLSWRYVLEVTPKSYRVKGDNTAVLFYNSTYQGRRVDIEKNININKEFIEHLFQSCIKISIQKLNFGFGKYFLYHIVEFIISSSRALYRVTVCLSLTNLLALTVRVAAEKCLIYVHTAGVGI